MPPPALKHQNASKTRVKAELEPLLGLYWWYWWGLAARWHGAAADGRPRPGRRLFTPGRPERGSQGAWLHPFLHPEPRSSQADPRQGGVCWVSFGRGLFLPCLVREGLACTGRVAPNNSWRGGGEPSILSQERRNEAFLFNPLFWDVTDVSSTRCRLRIAGLERFHLQPNADGAVAEPGLRWQSGARRVPVPPPGYIMGSRVVVQLRHSIPIPAAALGTREVKP